MVSTSKVLTVSYGTFSCTLEGFDDSFDTMKAIAEYFRDLAADDRYFGAEPPTPDAEMLARIAEREIARRVEAHQGDSGIVLRAARDEPAEPTEEAAPHPAALPEPEAAEAAETAALAEAQSGLEPANLDHAEDGEAQDDAVAASLPWDDFEQDIEQPEPDSVAARLRRIRSVVARAPEAEAEYSEDEHAQDFLGRTAADLEATLAEDDIAGAEPESDEVEDKVDVEDETIASLSARLSEGTFESEVVETAVFETEVVETEAPQEDVSEGDMPTEEATEDAVETAPSEDDIASDDIETDGAEAALSDTDDDDFDDGFAADTLAQLLADAIPPEAAPAPADDWAEPEAEPEAAQEPMQARVLKLKRSMLDAAIEEGRIEEMTEADERAEESTEESADADGGDTEEATLSPEEEADLQSELAEVEAELGEDTDAAEPEAGADATMPDEPEAAPRGTRLHRADTDSDATRLFDAADNHFDAADSSRRRNAIQHLRAAVAASKAETSAGGTLDDDDSGDESEYRSDLARVVRPRRPQPGPAEATPRPARPGEGRPAPLRLVAEQRVDTPREPVRPRRVAATPASPGDMAASDFGEYAEETGATTLTDLLEAAAAYLADVEGREQFSRPMLMRMLKEVRGEAFSREDGLRAFGHLLREGKLQKLQGGRFTVTEQTEFRAAERRAG